MPFSILNQDACLAITRTSFCCALPNVDLRDGNAGPFAPGAASDKLLADFAFFARVAPTFKFCFTPGLFGGVRGSPTALRVALQPQIQHQWMPRL